jgi:hypothetical protein
MVHECEPEGVREQFTSALRKIEEVFCLCFIYNDIVSLAY